MDTSNPEPNTETATPPPFPAAYANSTKHHTAVAPAKKKKKWLMPVLIAVGVLVVGVPVLGIVAAIAIPNVASIKQEADMKSLQSGIEASLESAGSPVENPVAVKIPAPTPDNAPTPTVAQTPVKAATPSVDLLGVNLTPDSPVWKTTGQAELREFLVDMWDFDKLAGDPFYDLSEIILTSILERPGPLADDVEMALLYLPRKITEYPELGCAALSILSDNDRRKMIPILESLLIDINDPLLSLQVMAQKARGYETKQAFDALQIVLDSTEAKPLSDEAAFYILSNKFLNDIIKTDPDRFIEMVESCSTLPRWLKDYKAAEALWFGINLKLMGYQGFDPNEIKNDIAAVRQKLEASWSANPDHPAAATLMIEVLNGDKNSPLTEYRKWFDRAIEARADYPRAYDSYLKVLTMHETTQNPMAVEFGKNCAKTERFDTHVPMLLIDAHVFRTVKLDEDSYNYFSQLSVDDKSDLQNLSIALDSAKGMFHNGVIEKSMMALTWFLAGDEQRSGHFLKQLGDDFDKKVFAVFKLSGVDKARFEDFRPGQ